ncbi:MAG: glycosyltransferase [Candidatus Parcubacteria bacterium]|nr:glycosyltransferase [Candidatus Parcubacteria bacterium]
MKISVILPTYNEKEGITDFIREILEVGGNNNLNLEILVVDDSSPDGTGKLVEETFKENPAVRVIIRKEKGLATAIKKGIEMADGDAVLLLDADGNYGPEYIPLFAGFFPEYDAVNGSRFISGGKMMGPQIHRWLSFIFSLLARLFLRLKATDSSSGIIIFKKDISNSLDMEKIFQGRHGEFFVSLLFALGKLKISFKEIPVICHPRSLGKSKTSLIKHPFFYALKVVKLRLGLD